MPKLFPYLQIHRVLGAELAARVLQYAIGREGAFKASSVFESGESQRLDETVRISRVTRDLGDLGPVLQARFAAAIPTFFEGLKLGRVALKPDCELELAAHGDGAFYKPHTDNRWGRPANRVISAVYYVHGTPRGFSGGGLRLHPNNLLPGDDAPVVLQPEHDSLVVFPSHVIHEVLPVACPSGAFSDYRFAINCWIHREGQSD